MKLQHITEQKTVFDIVIISKTKISLMLNDEVLFYATRRTLHVGKMAGGSKQKWYITNVKKGSEVGNTMTGYSKAEAIAKMRKFARSRS